jgi:hypothetical protein
MSKPLGSGTGATGITSPPPSTSHRGQKSSCRTSSASPAFMRRRSPRVTAEKLDVGDDLRGPLRDPVAASRQIG